MKAERSGSIRSATSSDLDKIQFNPRLSESSDSVITGKKKIISFFLKIIQAFHQTIQKNHARNHLQTRTRIIKEKLTLLGAVLRVVSIVTAVVVDFLA